MNYIDCKHIWNEMFFSEWRFTSEPDPTTWAWCRRCGALSYETRLFVPDQSLTRPPEMTTDSSPTPQIHVEGEFQTMTPMKVILEAMVPSTDYVVGVRATGAVHISTNVQIDRDHLEVSTPEDWESIVELVKVLQAAQSAALSSNVKYGLSMGEDSETYRTQMKDAGRGELLR